MNALFTSRYLVLVLALAYVAPVDAQVPEAWWTSKAGEDDQVLSPWTAIQSARVTDGGGARLDVSVWGRTYRFRNEMFPSEIIDSGRQILAMPMRLTGSLDGSEIAWTSGAQRKVTASTGSRFSFESSFEAGDLRLRGRTTVEYDGLVRFDIIITGERQVNLKNLRIEIPVDAQLATLRTWWPTPWGKIDNAGSLSPEGEKLPFKPYYWLGNEDLGLAWCCESDQHWYPRDPGQAIEVVRSAGRATLVLHLVDEQKSIGPSGARQSDLDTLRYSFAIQATPVKPWPKDWHLWCLDHGAYYGMETQETQAGKTVLDKAASAGTKTLIYHETWTDIQNYPLTTHERELRSLVKACHDRGMKLLVYFGYEMSNIAPEFKELSEKVLVRPRQGGYTRQPEQKDYVVCYKSAYANMLAAGISRLIDTVGIDGVYFDSTIMPWGCANSDHGCGYTTAGGALKPTYPIFAVRDFLRRAYALCTKKTGGMVNVHASASVIAPGLSFATSYWDGEQIAANPEKFPSKHIVDNIPLDMFRAEAMGRNIGVPADFLIYTDPPHNSRMDAIALGMLHDVPVRPSGFGPFLDEIAPIWRVWKSFDIDHATMYPYWKPTPYVTTGDDNIKVTVHKHPTRGVLLTVVNVGKETKKVKVTVAFDKFNLNVQRLAIRDAYANKGMRLTGGALEFPLAPMGLQWIWLR